METRAEPRFVPGEPVGISGFEGAGFDAKQVIVTAINYVPKRYNGYKGWYYGTDHISKGYAFSEPALVKLPADEVTTWDKCAWRPK